MANEIIEGNKLIAEFDGVKIGVDKYSWRIGCIEPIQESNLAYHKEWGWLMPVVEKIESLNLGTLKVNRFGNEHDAGFDTTFRNANVVFRIEYKDVHIDLVGDMQIWEGWKHIDKYHSKKEAVWFAVVEFIKWYNQNKQS